MSENRVNTYLNAIANGVRTDLNPHTREEHYLAAIAGEYDGELPKPCTVKEFLLEQIAKNGTGSGGGGGETEGVTPGYEIMETDDDGNIIGIKITGSMDEGPFMEGLMYGEIDLRNVKYAYFDRVPNIRRAFNTADGLDAVYVSEGCESFDSNMFAENAYLVPGMLPLSLKTIGKAAFANMHMFFNRIWAPGAETVGQQAFSGCTSLKSAVMGSKGHAVKSIEQDAFGGCMLQNLVVFVDNPANPETGAGPWGAMSTVVFKQA